MENQRRVEKIYKVHLIQIFSYFFLGIVLVNKQNKHDLTTFYKVLSL